MLSFQIEAFVMSEHSIGSLSGFGGQWKITFKVASEIDADGFRTEPFYSRQGWYPRLKLPECCGVIEKDFQHRITDSPWGLSALQLGVSSLNKMLQKSRASVRTGGSFSTASLFFVSGPVFDFSSKMLEEGGCVCIHACAPYKWVFADVGHR